MSDQIIPLEETVPCKVQYRERKYTDVIWGVINILMYIAFVVTGSVVVSRSHPRHVILEDGSRGLSEYYFDQAESCCARNNDEGYVCQLYEQTINGGGRRLSAGESKFDGDEGIFDAFVEAPEIIVGLLSTVVGVTILWVILLRFFAKPIVIVVEAVKVGILIYLGIIQENTQTSVYCFIIAALMVAYVIWQWKTIMFAAKMIEHSTISLKENPSVLVGSLVTKIFYAGNAALFVLFFAKSFDVGSISEYKYSDSYSYCEFVYPAYLQRLSIFWSLSYLWTILLFGQMRLSIVATIVGSWHFHPEDKPGVFIAISNIAKSYGTLSVSSLIATVADKVNRMMSEKGWLSWVSPFICFTWPLHCCMCIFGNCIHTCVKMLTNYAVVLHVFTGENFIGSAKNSYNILSRHFKGGFVTEYTSRSLFSIASYWFSVSIALIAWVWIDARFETQNQATYERATWILFIIVILVNIYFPVLGLYIMILLNKYLREWERTKLASLERDDDGNDGMWIWSSELTNHIWIPPLAATFVGCIAMMFFTFMSSMFLDIITTLFLCFAIDKDNNVDMMEAEFVALVKEMPNYIEKDDDTFDTEEGEIQTAVVVPAKPH